MRQILRPSLSLIMLVLIAGCGRSRHAEAFIKCVGSERLLQFAASYSIESRTNAATETRDATPPRVPIDFRNAGVLKINPYMNGVQFVLNASERVECGVYVTADLTEEPYSGSGISFEQVEPGIFLFEQKLRTISKASAERLRKERNMSADEAARKAP